MDYTLPLVLIHQDTDCAQGMMDMRLISRHRVFLSLKDAGKTEAQARLAPTQAALPELNKQK